MTVASTFSVAGRLRFLGDCLKANCDVQVRESGVLCDLCGASVILGVPNVFLWVEMRTSCARSRKLGVSMSRPGLIEVG